MRTCSSVHTVPLFHLGIYKCLHFAPCRPAQLSKPSLKTLKLLTRHCHCPCVFGKIEHS